MIASLSAQTPQTVSLGAGYMDQVWYSLQNGVQATHPANEWDLAFEIQGFTAAILINTQKAGLELHRAPYALSQWASMDTAGIAAWPILQNADTSWSHGAFNEGITSDPYDLGWGVYNPITHIVTGDSLYVVRLANGTWRKLRIDALTTGVYTFTHANIDGSDEVSGAISKIDFTGKNFAYWSLETNTAIDREPLSADWDITFCRYVTFIPGPYAVTGVLHNKQVTASRSGGAPPADAVWTDAVFNTHINTIGFDWKTFDMGTFQYVIEDSLAYFVKDVPGNIWKVVFTGFDGSSSGNIAFTTELVSLTGMSELMDPVDDLSVFPNPSSDGTIQLLFCGTMDQATVFVLDPAGRVVLRKSLEDHASDILRMDVSALSAGVYSVRVDTPGGSRVARCVIE